jgi:4-carboxymuconolactone decarboxylase
MGIERSPHKRDAEETLAAELGISPQLMRLNIFRVASDAPRMAGLIANIVDVIVLNGSLDKKLRETAILHTAWRLNCSYEWATHYPIARRVGLSDEEVVACRGRGRGLSKASEITVHLVDELIDNDHVSEATWSAVRQILHDEASRMELVAIAGLYRAIGALIEVYQIPIDDQFGMWLPDGNGPVG